MFFVSGPLFTPCQEFLTNFLNVSVEFSTPRKHTETRFCNKKGSNNAIIVKIVESEIDFRILLTAQQRLDETRYAAYLEDIGIVATT